MGLIEEIPETTILSNAVVKDGTVRGRANWVDGRLGRFGLKAQVATLFEFMFIAAAVELGATSPFLPNRIPNECGVRVVGVRDSHEGQVLSAKEIFDLLYFVKFLAPPTPTARSNRDGAEIFERIGCASCHVPSFTTKESKIAALSTKTISPYSDFLLHDMGDTLQDGMEQGVASARDFRTAPLWGLRYRRLFLHDGRATSVRQAIEAHDGEARTSAREFARLRDAEVRELLKFLSSI